MARRRARGGVGARSPRPTPVAATSSSRCCRACASRRARRGSSATPTSWSSRSSPATSRPCSRPRRARSSRTRSSLSIAAGVSIAALEAAAPDRPVVRAMPNTPGARAGGRRRHRRPGTHATDAHVETARRLLGAVGRVVVVGESALDAVTGLSGSGPAYVFLLAEAMIEAGVLNGLPRDVAAALVHGTDPRRRRHAHRLRRHRGAAPRRGHLTGRHDRGRAARARGRRGARRSARGGHRGDPPVARAGRASRARPGTGSGAPLRSAACPRPTPSRS